jgi:hypothetical protein
MMVPTPPRCAQPSSSELASTALRSRFTSAVSPFNLTGGVRGVALSAAPTDAAGER